LSLVTGHPLIDEIATKLGTKPDERMGIRTGLSQFDAMTRGFLPSKLYTIAARPGCGKTSFATTIIANMMLHRLDNVLMFSTELDEAEVMMQVTEAYVQGVPIYPNKRVSTPDEIARLEAGLFDLSQQLRYSHIKVVHEKKLTGEFIERTINNYCDGDLGGQIALVLIDQANRIRRADRDRHGYAIATEHMLNDLEDLAKRNGVPVAIFSQANRQTEGQKHIGMANIKHSGAFEEYSHGVVLLEKEDGHGKLVPGSSQRNNNATIHVAKNRSGPVGPIPAMFIGESHLWREREVER
jgi:replicative DNA helicase